MMGLEQTTFMIKLTGKVWKKPHLADLFPFRPKPRPSLTCVRRTVVISWSRYDKYDSLTCECCTIQVEPLSGPRSFHLRTFSLGLSKSSFSAFVASSLCSSLLFWCSAADTRVMDIFFLFVFSSSVSASEAQGNRWTQGRGCPRCACPLSARERIDRRWVTPSVSDWLFALDRSGVFKFN